MSESAPLDVFDRRESEVRGYIRAFPTVFDRAVGSTLIDADGREYLDFFAGAGVLNYGHNNPVFTRALIEYLERDGIIHGLDMATSAKKAFIEAFERFVLEPRGLDHKLQFTGPTGANAVEAALKVARQATGRSTVVAFTNGFHGLSLGALAATGNSHYRDRRRGRARRHRAPPLRRLPRAGHRHPRPAREDARRPGIGARPSRGGDRRGRAGRGRHQRRERAVAAAAARAHGRPRHPAHPRRDPGRHRPHRRTSSRSRRRASFPIS